MSTVKVTVLGAAQTVTGSKYLVETSQAKVLVDCGLFQGKKELRVRNWEMPTFQVPEITAIVLTHAHIDHIGYLPRLIKFGYNGPIYCTPATAQFVNLLLMDSAFLQEEEARHANKHATSRHKPALPLYTQEDAKATLQLIRPIARNKVTEIAPGCKVFFTCAGHILGATSLSLEADGKRITFSGDIGRYDAPILPDPQPHDIGELLFCESTYGDRVHDTEHTEQRLTAVVQDVVTRGGPLIIPAFALGRTQTLLYYFAKLEREGKIPSLPLYVDSPMAIDSTKIYRDFHHDYDDEAVALMKAGKSPLLTQKTNFCQSSQDSKRLNTLKGPRIIISASGMVTGGRIMHHLIHWLPDERSTVLFVGYQAEETRGRTILSGAPTVKIFGKEIPIRANVEEISGLSAHGDRLELLRWLKSSNGTPRVVRITHGEPAAATFFAGEIEKELGWKAAPAQMFEEIEV